MATFESLPNFEELFCTLGYGEIGSLKGHFPLPDCLVLPMGGSEPGTPMPPPGDWNEEAISRLRTKLSRRPLFRRAKHQTLVSDWW